MSIEESFTNWKMQYAPRKKCHSLIVRAHEHLRTIFSTALAFRLQSPQKGISDVDVNLWGWRGTRTSVFRDVKSQAFFLQLNRTVHAIIIAAFTTLQTHMFQGGLLHRETWPASLHGIISRIKTCEIKDAQCGRAQQSLTLHAKTLLERTSWWISSGPVSMRMRPSKRNLGYSTKRINRSCRDSEISIVQFPIDNSNQVSSPSS